MVEELKTQGFEAKRQVPLYVTYNGKH
ncbi:hypothetical protein [Fodinibius saliphilus]